MFHLLSLILYHLICQLPLLSADTKHQASSELVQDSRSEEADAPVVDDEENSALDEDEETQEEELSLPPFTLLELGYFDALSEDMVNTQQYPFNPIEGQGRELAFDAQNGDAVAQYSVGLSMVAFTFHDLDRVTQVRRSWLRQSAMQGYKPAQKLLALLYLNSAGAPRLSKALSWLNALAQNGDAEAKSELLFLASHGLIEDLATCEAREQLRAMADDEAELDGIDARARYSVQLALGMHAALGLGGQERDVAQALHYFSKTRAYSLPNCQAAILSMGDYSPDDESLSRWERDLFSLAEQGDPEACYVYALWLYEGLSTDAQITDAEELSQHYLRVAASKGLADAHYELGRRVIDPWSDSLEGELSEEQQEALSHYQQANELGCSAAAASLSRCYEKMGRLDEAEQILRKAIDRGGYAMRENKYELAALLLEWEREEEARDIYESMVLKADKEATIQLIELYHYKFDDDASLRRATELLEQLEKVDPSRAHYLRSEMD